MKKRHIPLSERVGDMEIVDKFLIFPMTINGETKVLEKVRIRYFVQKYFVRWGDGTISTEYRWNAAEWLDIKGDLAVQLTMPVKVIVYRVLTKKQQEEQDKKDHYKRFNEYLNL